MIAVIKTSLLLGLLLAYIDLNVRGLFLNPNGPLYGYLEWRIGLILAVYYFLYGLFGPVRPTLNALLVLFSLFLGTLTALSPLYTFALLANEFRLQAILHLCLLVTAVEYGCQWAFDGFGHPQRTRGTRGPGPSTNHAL